MAYQSYYPYYPQFPQNGASPDLLNQFKSPYQPQMQMNPVPQQVPQVPATQPSNDIIWVQGEAGAKAYLVAPNATVTLWDSENQTIYIKSADASGIPSMRILDWSERNAQKPQEKHECKCGDRFVRKEIFSDFEKRIENLENQIKEIQTQKTAKNKAVKDGSDND